MKHCELVAREDNCFEFEMEMGEPQVGGDFSIRLAFGQVHGTPVSMGNPHYVVFVKEFSPDGRRKARRLAGITTSSMESTWSLCA